MKRRMIFLSLALFILDSILLVAILNKKFIISDKFLFPKNINPTPTPSLTPSPRLTPSPTPSPTSTPKKVYYSPTPKISASGPLTLDDLFTKYGAIYGVSVDILKKIAGCESGFDPNQITGDYVGLFQFGSTPWIEARGRLGADNNLSLRFNAEESIRTAAHEIQIKGTSGWDDCD